MSLGTDQPVAMYGMSNIIRGSFSINYIADQVPDRVIGTYFDETDNYEEKESANRPDLVGNPKTEFTVPLFGVTSGASRKRNKNFSSKAILPKKANYLGCRYGMD